jgi:hypothetical protein
MVGTAIVLLKAREVGWLRCSGWCRLDVESAGEGNPDCLCEEFASRPIERPGSIYQLARNGHGHLGATLVRELYPGRNQPLVGFLQRGLVKGGRDNPVLWI